MRTDQPELGPLLLWINGSGLAQNAGGKGETTVKIFIRSAEATGALSLRATQISRYGQISTEARIYLVLSFLAKVCLCDMLCVHACRA